MLIRNLEHMSVDLGTLVTGEPDVACFALLARPKHGFERATWREDALGLFHADHFVELQEVDVIGLQALQRLLELPSGAFGAATIDLGHQERLVSIAVA